MSKSFDFDLKHATAGDTIVFNSGKWRNASGSSLGPGYRSISPNTSFDTAVAGAPLVNNYQFGTAVADAPDVTPIRNLVDLAAHFTALENPTGQTAIQGQIEQYQAFNATNHAIISDRLNLQAVNPNNDWNAQVSEAVGTVNLNGTANPIANLGLANTTGLRVGQLVAYQFKGIYFINAIVVNTSVSLTTLSGAPTTAGSNNLLFWLPVDSALLTVASAQNNPVLTFAAVPAAVVTGYQVCYANSGSPIVRSKNYRVLSADATTVTLDQGWADGTQAINTRILFLPYVTTGQIWGLDSFDITNTNVFFAMELSCDLLAGSATASLLNVNTMAEFNAVPVDAPWGAWPAYWTFGFLDGVADHNINSSELDVMEMFNSTTAPSSWVAGNNHGSGITANLFTKNSGGWTSGSGFTKAPYTLTGPLKFQLIYANSKVYRFINGICTKIDQYQWSNQSPMNIAANMSVGSLMTNYASNVMFPMASTNFPSFRYGIKSMKVWYLAP